MTTTVSDQPIPHTSPQRWRPSGFTWLIVVLALTGLLTGLYPMTASWISSYNQSQIIEQALDLEQLDPAAETQWALAQEYNNALRSGVKLEAGGNVPVGTGNLTGTELKYEEMLNTNDQGLMARVKIPSIDVDLPIYHGTDEDTLLRGAGHLEGTHLPVGGEGTRSVITAHRGLANATMFTNLDKVVEGDVFTIETLGKPLAYEVIDIQVIEPDDTGSLQAVEGQDLVTLITCTPLGVNTHRILVTGQRIDPTPEEVVLEAGTEPTIPGFPWWAVLGGSGMLLIGGYLIRRGFIDPAMTTTKDSNIIAHDPPTGNSA